MQTGDIIQRCTSDVEVVHTFLSAQLFELFRTLVLVVTAMCFLFAIDARLTWVCLAFIPVIILYSALFYRAIAGRFLAADEAEGDLSACVQENFTGVRVVRAFAGRHTKSGVSTRRTRFIPRFGSDSAGFSPSTGA